MAKPNWITLSKSSGTGGGSVNVTATANSGTNLRTGSLTIKTASELTKTVFVSQGYNAVKASILYDGDITREFSVTSGAATFSGITCLNTTHIAVNGTAASLPNTPARVDAVVGDNGITWRQEALPGDNEYQMGDWVRNSGLTSVQVSFAGLNSGTVPATGVTVTISVANYALAHGDPNADDTLTLSIVYRKQGA